MIFSHPPESNLRVLLLFFFSCLLQNTIRGFAQAYFWQANCLTDFGVGAIWQYWLLAAQRAIRVCVCVEFAGTNSVYGGSAARDI